MSGKLLVKYSEKEVNICHPPGGRGGRKGAEQKVVLYSRLYFRRYFWGSESFTASHILFLLPASVATQSSLLKPRVCFVWLDQYWCVPLCPAIFDTPGRNPLWRWYATQRNWCKTTRHLSEKQMLPLVVLHHPSSSLMPTAVLLTVRLNSQVKRQETDNWKCLSH